MQPRVCGFLGSFRNQAGTVCQRHANLRKMGPRLCEHHPFSLGVTPAAEHAMFTGIIENSGAIESLSIDSQGGRVTIHAPDVAPSLALANSIAVPANVATVMYFMTDVLP